MPYASAILSESGHQTPVSGPSANRRPSMKLLCVCLISKYPLLLKMKTLMGRLLCRMVANSWIFICKLPSPVTTMVFCLLFARHAPIPAAQYPMDDSPPVVKNRCPFLIFQVWHTTWKQVPVSTRTISFSLDNSDSLSEK